MHLLSYHISSCSRWDLVLAKMHPAQCLTFSWCCFFCFFVFFSVCGSLIVQCSGLFDGSIKPFLRRNILALSQAPTQLLFIACSVVKWLQALENRVRVGGWGQLSLVLRSCCDTVMLMICGSVLVLSEQQSMTRLESWLVGFVCDLHVCSCLW